jgi:hypothetical protein
MSRPNTGEPIQVDVSYEHIVVYGLQPVHLDACWAG